MRDPNRLDPFYQELKRIHKEKFPDMRFGQLMVNFFGWLGKDPWFAEETTMIEYFKCFARGGKPDDIKA